MILWYIEEAKCIFTICLIILKMCESIFLNYYLFFFILTCVTLIWLARNHIIWMSYYSFTLHFLFDLNSTYFSYTIFLRLFSYYTWYLLFLSFFLPIYHWCSLFKSVNKTLTYGIKRLIEKINYIKCLNSSFFLINVILKHCMDDFTYKQMILCSPLKWNSHFSK